ncbi:ABC transporter ATP-binding protein [Castellaniella defragrans]|nr:ABC transporter ATP-binding protein [Castellaniella defragrans]KAB0622605.1 ABC transporter ATP-binding protein [Castellaniella defragrans]
MLEMDGVSKHYGRLRVAGDVSLAVQAGEALGIIGPNGAGKTTIFNLIAGTVAPDSGRILFDGEDVSALPARARCHRGIARSFQIPHPFAGMSTYENVLVGAAFGRRRTERDSAAKAVEVLELTGLRRKANVLAGQLTLLERKRLEMARALASEPRLLLLDEIAGGLTEPECRELVAAIAEVRRAGVAILWIEHVVHALLAVVDRIAVIDAGRKIAEGEPHAVMASRAVAEIYMGAEAAHG